ncbi:ferritin-like protein [Chitinophaga skermanii]|uniref:Ferritin-like protein n=1 Tax=Chitinophaga skermanii TaxID=331697 RepID=A0A327QVA7_9BACT|nr:ferritin-like domain-containing protein [Chitinophaga skermanii]RAJ08549.1 ferritin-like protein [Chitinophaga skermanii]
MNLQNILNEFEKADPEFYERTDTRRQSLKNFAGIGAKLALTAIPLAFGSFLKKAYAGSVASQSEIAAILNYALTLEYLEAEFYQIGRDTSGLVPAGPPSGAISTIATHEANHVKFLKAAIPSVGGTPVAKPTFDFTAGGLFGNVFSNYNTFLAVAQTFEDTGVRAYKGRAAELVGTGDILQAALNIHSVEARHASHIRSMRKALGASVQPWITGKETGIGDVVQGSYNGEENVIQANIDISQLPVTNRTIGFNSATEAFDEELKPEDVLKIVKPFIVP